jgi:hypothetical protein
VYDNTPDQYLDAEARSTKSTTVTAGGTLVLEISAAGLEKLIEDSNFSAVVRSHGELADGLLCIMPTK